MILRGKSNGAANPGRSTALEELDAQAISKKADVAIMENRNDSIVFRNRDRIAMIEGW
jgi:hypothetical protein